MDVAVDTLTSKTSFKYNFWLAETAIYTHFSVAQLGSYYLHLVSYYIIIQVSFCFTNLSFLAISSVSLQLTLRSMILIYLWENQWSKLLNIGIHLCCTRNFLFFFFFALRIFQILPLFRYYDDNLHNMKSPHQTAAKALGVVVEGRTPLLICAINVLLVIPFKSLPHEQYQHLVITCYLDYEFQVEWKVIWSHLKLLGSF